MTLSTQFNAPIPAPNSRAIAGSAVFTTAMSSISIAVAVQTTASVRRCVGRTGAAAPGAGVSGISWPVGTMSVLLHRMDSVKE